MDEYSIIHYLTPQELDVFNIWLKQLRDMDAKVSISRRINRVEQGNLGDHKPCRDGVWELRFGNGYRVYYAKAGPNALLLLNGGTKASQRTDIDRAVLYWKDWKQRNNHGTHA
jgi:putative addiction module killer protein